MRIFVTTLQELEECPSRVVQIGNKQLLLIRSGQNIHVVSAFCPHRGAPLAEGTVIENLIICPWHRSMFDLCSGKSVNGASQQALEIYSVAIDEGDVYVELEY